MAVKSAISNVSDEYDDGLPEGTAIVLGAKQNNPYSLANMEAAANSLLKPSAFRAIPNEPGNGGGDGGDGNSGDGPAEDADAPGGESGGGGSITLFPTHYYVRFLPKSEAEKDLLKKLELELFEYPLDYEVTQEGDYYQDPSLPTNNFTWQYTNMPANMPFPAIQYEILDKLFLNHNGEAQTTQSRSRSTMDDKGEHAFIPAWEDMECQSLINSENEFESGAGGRISPKSWYPSGRITMQDNYKKTIPLEGVKVRIRYKNNFCTEYTDANGYFKSRRYFMTPVTYEIVWEQPKWDIRNGLFGQATYAIKNLQEPFNLHIDDKIGRVLGCAAVHRALMTYYFGDIEGLIRINNTNPIKIAYRHNRSGASKYIGSEWHLGILAAVRIKGQYSSGAQRPPQEIYSTTIHELAHASHAFQTNLYNLINNGLFRESWASAVEWFLTNKEYLWRFEKKLPNNLIIPSDYNHQNWHVDRDYAIYSSLFINLVDDSNEYEYFQLQDPNTTVTHPNDRVNGYTMSFLNRALSLVKSVPELKTYLLTNPKPAGVTNEDIELLFVE